MLEYLEGETLADRLRRSPSLPVVDAIAMAIQIGDALDRAHREGIVHRDLKPGNVMLIRRSGPTGLADVKLLDFGLAARTTAARPQLSHASLAETLAPSMVATRPPTTTVLSGFSGTVQYMSPEQLSGDTVDQRADIFAFGCVLYEMLAGRKAFEGTSVVTAIAAIMSSEPSPINALRAAHPLLDHVWNAEGVILFSPGVSSPVIRVRRAGAPSNALPTSVAAAVPITAGRSFDPTANDSCSRQRSAPRRPTAYTSARSTKRRRSA